MSRYYLNLWSKVPEFSSFLPQGKQEDFKTTVLEGMETAKHQVRVALDACHLARAAKSGIEAADGFFTTSAMWEPCIHVYGLINSGTSDKEHTCQSRRHKRHRFDPSVGTLPWKRA